MENALKIFSVIMVIIVVAAAISMLPQQVDNFVGQESDVSEASYIIYQDDSYYCLKNGSTGRIEARSVSFHDVIESALSINNTEIVITSGTYTHSVDDGPINATGTDVSVRCLSGTVLTVDNSTDIFVSVNATGFSWTGGTFDMTGLVNYTLNIQGISSNVTVKDATFRNAAQNSAIRVSPNTQNISGFQVSGCTITGGKNAINFEGSISYKIADVVVNENTIHDISNVAIRTVHSSVVTVSNNIIYDVVNPSDPSYFYSDGICTIYTDYIVIESNQVHNIQSFGILVSEQCSYVTVADNTVSYCGRMGIDIDTTTNHVPGGNGSAPEANWNTYYTVTGNVVRNVTTYNAISINGADFGTVTGNTVLGRANIGIYVNGENASVSANSVTGCTQGMYFGAWSNNSKVTTNVVTGCTYGIIVSPLSNGTCMSNELEGNAQSFKTYNDTDPANMTSSGYCKWLIAFNSGFITEQSGSAIIPAGQDHVYVYPYDFWQIPTYISVTGTSNYTAGCYVDFIWSFYPHDFKITAPGGAVPVDTIVYWYIEVRP